MEVVLWVVFQQPTINCHIFITWQVLADLNPRYTRDEEGVSALGGA